MAVRTVGVERLLFGCDLSLCGGIGKIRGADLPEDAKKRILGGNMQGILARRVGAT
jgi:hypothetical protein